MGGLYLDIVFGTSRLRRLLLWCGGAAVLSGLCLLLSAAGNLYLIASIVLLLVQRGYVAGHHKMILERLRNVFVRETEHVLPEGVLPLDRNAVLSGCGNKAYRLSVLRSADVPVPNSIVLTSQFLGRYLQHSEIQKQQML